MNTLCKVLITLGCAVLLLSTGCRKKEELSGAQPVTQYLVKDHHVESINGTPVNWPDSENLHWTQVTSSNPVDPKLVAIGQANISPPSTASKHTLRVRRFATIGDCVLLCASFEPPMPDGSMNWVVDKRSMTYVGSFLDKDSR